MVLNDITNLQINSDSNLDSESDLDSESNSNITYNSDNDEGVPKYCLGLCILWSKDVHGHNSSSSPGIETHWLLHEEIMIDEFFEQELDWIENYRQNIEGYLSMMTQNLSIHHPLLRNYTDIVSRPLEPKIDIIIREYLPGQEAVAYIKTFWIRLIQKRWKKLYHNRKVIISNRCRIQNLTYRQTHGKWPRGLNHLPSISQIINF